MTLAGALAWALLLSGWLGIGRLALTADPEPAPVCGWFALWLLALAAASAALQRWRPTAASLRCCLAWAALASAAALGAWQPAGALPWLLPVTLAWAGLVALAFAGVHRRAGTGRAHAAPRAAAAGALLAWLAVGGIDDTRLLALRMAALAVVAGALLAQLQPRRGGAGAPAMAGCAGFGWPAGGAAAPQLPLRLALLGMLPMMLGLPWAGVLCSGDGSSPTLMLALHLSSMFVPALLVGHRPALAAHAAAASAVLLLLGALALLLAPRAGAAPAVAVAHGTAWSLAWAATAAASAGPLPQPRPWRNGLFSALAACALGLAVGAAGMRVFADLHTALGLLAGAWLAVRFGRRPATAAVKRLQLRWRSPASQPAAAQGRASSNAPNCECRNRVAVSAPADSKIG